MGQNLSEQLFLENISTLQRLGWVMLTLATVLNMADHGFTVVAFNRTVSKVDRFLQNEARGTIEKFSDHLCAGRRLLALLSSVNSGNLWLIGFRHRQIDHRQPHSRGVCFEVEEAPPNDAACPSRKGCR